MSFYGHFRLIKALKVGCYNIRFARIENLVGSKHPPSIEIGTIWPDFGECGDFVLEAQT